MTTHFEYGVNLTDKQKKLADSINNKCPLTLKLKHLDLAGNDELMLTKSQITKIRKSLANRTGVDLKISKTQIRKIAKHGGNLFTSLASLGASSCNNMLSSSKFPYSPIQNPYHFSVIFFHSNYPSLISVIFMSILEYRKNDGNNQSSKFQISKFS